MTDDIIELPATPVDGDQHGDDLAAAIDAAQSAPPADLGPWFYAQLDDDGRCTGVTQAAGPIDASHMLRIDALDVSLIGRTHDSVDGWAEPEPPAAVPRHITRLAFLQRFDDSEAVAIDLASMGATPQAAGMRRYMQLVNAATYIDLDRPDTRAGVIALEAAGLLAAGRALEILDAPMAASEIAKA